MKAEWNHLLVASHSALDSVPCKASSNVGMHHLQAAGTCNSLTALYWQAIFAYMFNFMNHCIFLSFSGEKKQNKTVHDQKCFSSSFVKSMIFFLHLPADFTPQWPILFS